MVSENLILVGQIAAAYGLSGWLKVRPYSSSNSVLTKINFCWVDKPNLKFHKIVQVRVRDASILLKFDGIDNRTNAENLRGSGLYLKRSDFPAPEKDEYYWVDLIGNSVENQNGEFLGKVTSLTENGAHSLLIVENKSIKNNKIIIPFVKKYILEIDDSKKRIVVYWELDF